MLGEIKIKESILDKEANDILIALLAFIKTREEANFSEDDIETELLEVLESAGIDFSR